MDKMQRFTQNLFRAVEHRLDGSPLSVWDLVDYDFVVVGKNGNSAVGVAVADGFENNTRIVVGKVGVLGPEDRAPKNWTDVTEIEILSDSLGPETIASTIAALARTLLGDPSSLCLAKQEAASNLDAVPANRILNEFFASEATVIVYDDGSVYVSDPSDAAGFSSLEQARKANAYYLLGEDEAEDASEEEWAWHQIASQIDDMLQEARDTTPTPFPK